ncbi:MAG: nuclear transport factor 2 family protein [Chitinophagaceae bacterium]
METLASVKSEKNISITQKGFADFLSGNIKGIVDACADNVQWGSYDNPGVPFAGMYHGKKGVADFFSSLGGTVEYRVFEPKAYYADKDSVLVHGRQEGTVKSTGKSFAHDFMMHFKMEDEKIVYFFAFVDSKDEADAFTN